MVCSRTIQRCKLQVVDYDERAEGGGGVCPKTNTVLFSQQLYALLKVQQLAPARTDRQQAGKETREEAEPAFQLRRHHHAIQQINSLGECCLLVGGNARCERKRARPPWPRTRWLLMRPLVEGGCHPNQ